MNAPFPISLDLTERRCAVIGTGALAEEKATALAEAGADVVRFSGSAEAKFGGIFLAVSTLDDTATNARLRREARGHATLFNALDDPPNCDYYFPAVHRHGELVVALSTNGQCPALGVRLKERLAEWVGPEYGQFLAIAREIRPRIRASALPFPERRALWYRLVDSSALELLKKQRQAEAREVLEAILTEAFTAVEAKR